MKILIIINNLGKNGTPLFALDVCELLTECGNECFVISLKNGILYEKFEKYNIRVLEFYQIDDWEAFAQNYDIAIPFTVLTYWFYFQLSKYIPTFWYIHEGKNIEKFFENNLCYDIFLNAENIVVVSEYVKKLYSERYHKECEVIHNFVRNKKEICVKEKNDEIIRFLVAGTLSPRKAFDVAIEAFDLLSFTLREKVQLLICGERTEKDRYVSNIIEKIRARSWIEDLGELSRDETLNTIAMVDYVLVPSRDESCSLIVLEAMMLGKPVIISDSVGAQYMVDSDTGWILRTDDIQELSQVIQHILVDGCQYNIMSKKAQEVFYEHCKEKTYKNRLYKIINESIEKFKPCVNDDTSKDAYLYLKNPFDKFYIPSNSKIVLYGAGVFGQKWKRIFELTNYCEVVLWVDKKINNSDVSHISNISNVDFDYIFVALFNENIYEEVKEELILNGIEGNKILFQGNCSTWLKH